MTIHQIPCREQNNIDLRQANAVIKHKPNIIIFEAPANTGSPLFLDSNQPILEQKELLKGKISNLKKVAKTYRWVESDIKVFENAFDLIKSGHELKIYNVDGPSELLQEALINKWNLIDKPRRRGVHLLWWVYIFLRERIMTENIRSILKENKDKSILVFLQKFHWLNVQFQLSNPSKDKLWNYYFGKFENMNRKDMVNILKKENEVLYKYWVRYSGF